MLKRLIADLGWLRFLLVCVTLLVIACAPLADMRLQHGWHLWPSVIAPTFMAMLAFSLPLDITMARVFMADAAGAVRARYRRIIRIEIVLWMLMLLAWTPYMLAITRRG